MKVLLVHEKSFELTKLFSVSLGRNLRSCETEVSPSFGHLSGHTIIEVPEIHPLPSHRPRGAGGKSKKRGFCFCEGIIEIAHIHPFPKSRMFSATGLPKIAGQRPRFLGRGGAERACELCPEGQSESAADCSDEGALSEKRLFRTRNRLLKEGTFLFCHPERSRPQGGAVAPFCVTLSEPPRRNGGESNGSEPFHMLAICSLCCFGGLHTAFNAFGSDPSTALGMTHEAFLVILNRTTRWRRAANLRLRQGLFFRQVPFRQRGSVSFQRQFSLRGSVLFRRRHSACGTAPPSCPSPF